MWRPQHSTRCWREGTRGSQTAGQEACPSSQSPSLPLPLFAQCPSCLTFRSLLPAWVFTPPGTCRQMKSAQVTSGRGARQAQSLALLWFPSHWPPLRCPSLVSSADGEKPETRSGGQQLPFHSQLGFCGPPTPLRGPAHLHEVPMVLQHAAGRLPGVLIALPRVHPARGGKRFPLVSSVFSYWFPPKSTAQGLSRPGHAVHLDLKSDTTWA